MKVQFFKIALSCTTPRKRIYSLGGIRYNFENQYVDVVAGFSMKNPLYFISFVRVKFPILSRKKSDTLIF